MAEFDIVEQTGHIIVEDDADLLAWLQSKKCTEILDRHPNLKVEVIYRNEVN